MKKTFRGAALKTKQIQTSTWITWTACKRKDRLLSEPSTMALLTCRHWTAMVRSTMQHYACSPSCVAMICSSNQKVCEVYNTLESPVFESSPSEQIMNFSPFLPHYPKHLKLNDITYSLCSFLLAQKKTSGPTLGPSPEASPSKPGPSNRTPFTAPERDSTAKCTVSHMVYA